jgi:4-alpha-glucanotransferase
LLHITSLPGGHGNGDLGPEARRFADFLAQAKQSWWQLLPIGPTGEGHSPYSACSAFAGNPLLISLDDLVKDGLLSAGDLENFSSKEELLRKVSTRVAHDLDSPFWTDFRRFDSEQNFWLENYTWYCSLKERFGGRPWIEWPEAFRFRKFREWDRETLRALGEASFHHKFVQFLFERQWEALRSYCAERGVGLIGDVPLFISHDSADVWACRDIFELDESGAPTVVSGVPPDYYNPEGQLWGQPIYRWKALAAKGYDWWIKRLGWDARRFSALRLDHFIGYHNYWEIPAGALTAAQGRWVPGPGAEFLSAVTKALPQLELIAEDLGSVTPEVTALRDQFDLPGMRILQFSAGEEVSEYPRRAVAYTGTHDNDTIASYGIPWDMIAQVWRSGADTAIVPAQDLLGLGSEARMNRPGVPEGNWRWRLLSGQLSPEIAQRLKSLTEECGRAA